MKLDVQTAPKGRHVETLCVSDIQEDLFRLDTFFTKEQAALEYALNKLEAQRTFTKLEFDKVIKQADSLKQSGLDSNLLETSSLMGKNMDGLKNSGKAFEKEMHARFLMINESIKKLKY